ncbi:hypothetical protein [Mycetocola manganoxydans]|uniref:hypothetical protein n=1 Tax=Mycetocola manganoxydans TaxID=699879 RepID=UPI0011C360FD|nr:hypothetical protein [Mycetocola manganoxydans]
MQSMGPDELVVVRGGSLRDPSVLHELVLDNEEMGLAALSVFAAKPLNGELFADVVRRICGEAKIPHGKVQVATEASLTKAGFRLEPDTSDGQPDHHHHVLFTSPVQESQSIAFVEAFSAPIENPARSHRIAS